MIFRRRHTRDGARRRDSSGPVDPRARFRPHAPKSDDDPATQETAAGVSASAAAAAAAVGDTPTARTHAKAAARAAAAARAGANSTGGAADTAAAASAEAYAIAAVDSVLASLSTYTTNAPECRNRGGTALLCGHSECTDPSVPPKKYKTLTFSGSVHATVYNNQGSSCGDNNGGYFDITYTGAATYDPASCSLISTGTQSFSINGDSPSLSNLSTWPGISSGCTVDVTKTKTTFAAVSTEDCCPTGPVTNQVHVGGRYAEASDEDTEDDAIARLLAAASWSSWAAAGSTTCKASYEQRTSGFSFVYQEAEFRDTISIPEGETGILKVGLYRRAYGSSDPWVLYATEIFLIEGNSSDQDTISFGYTADPGYEAYAAGLPVGS